MTLDAYIGLTVFIIGLAALVTDVAWETALNRPVRRAPIGSAERAEARRIMVFTLMGAHSGGPYPRP